MYFLFLLSIAVISNLKADNSAQDNSVDNIINKAIASVSNLPNFSSSDADTQSQDDSNNLTQNTNANSLNIDTNTKDNFIPNQLYSFPFTIADTVKAFLIVDTANDYNNVDQDLTTINAMVSNVKKIFSGEDSPETALYFLNQLKDRGCVYVWQKDPENKIGEVFISPNYKEKEFKQDYVIAKERLANEIENNKKIHQDLDNIFGKDNSLLVKTQTLSQEEQEKIKGQLKDGLVSLSVDDLVEIVKAVLTKEQIPSFIEKVSELLLSIKNIFKQ